MLVNQTPQEFFEQLLQEALQAQSLTVSEPVRLYLVRVLVDPARGPEHGVRETPTERWLRFLGGVSDVERIRLLRSIGEDVLFMCGFWWQQVHRVYRHTLNARYYIDLGRVAYSHLGQDQFTEVADTFPQLVDSFIMIGSTCLMRTDEDIIRLLDLWRTTHSAYAAKLLAAQGIPVSVLRPTTPS